MPEGFIDPYLEPETGILRNLVGASTSAELAQAEADLVAVRIIQLRDHQLVPSTRDLHELQGLHRHLFQDIFPWAGEIRTIDMRRGDGDFFAPCAGIPVNLDNVFVSLSHQGYLQDLGEGEFLKALAHFYDDLNFIHPFREGNGRAQRLFWSRVAFDAGWILDWAPVYGSELNESSRLAREKGDVAALEKTLAKCVRPIQHS